MDSYILAVVLWWRGLSLQAVWYLWLAGGVVGLLAWAWLGHRLLRRLAGHRKFRGNWYNERQFQELLLILAEDQANGHRVMRHDEIALLREWRQGSIKGLGYDGRNSYFS